MGLVGAPTSGNDDNHSFPTEKSLRVDGFRSSVVLRMHPPRTSGLNID